MIRIEDTDVERSDPAMVEPILNALKWLGLEWDEDIVYQSSRLETYKKFANKLLESGHGYRCFCSPAQLGAEREAAMASKQAPRYNRRCLKLTKDEIDAKLKAGEQFAIRIQIPPGETSYDDMVAGVITRQNDDIEDLVVARSDSSPTYNLAVVVDDHEMGITHVIRGNDHISNTFKQIQIYRALGFDVPRFGHVPLILRPDKKKVSKRLGDKDVAEYRNEGIIPEAMFNFLCLLGWSPKSDQEIFTITELIKIFDPTHFNSSNAVFDEEKLVSFNKSHLQLKTDEELASLITPLFVEAGLISQASLQSQLPYIKTVAGLLKERVRRLTDFLSLGSYFFKFDCRYDPEAEAKQFSTASAELLSAFAEKLEALPLFDHASIEQALTSLAEERGVKKAAFIHPTRLAVSGISVGPSLYDMIAVLGKPIVVERLKKTVDYIASKA